MKGDIKLEYLLNVIFFSNFKDAYEWDNAKCTAEVEKRIFTLYPLFLSNKACIKCHVWVYVWEFVYV